MLAWAVLTGLAGWLLPLLTVHLPHRHHGNTPLTVAGSLRWRVVPRLLLGLTYHLEHHLCPQVPSHHMAELSRRLRPFLYAAPAARASRSAASRRASTRSPARSSSQIRLVATSTTSGTTQTITR